MGAKQRPHGVIEAALVPGGVAGPVTGDAVGGEAGREVVGIDGLLGRRSGWQATQSEGSP